MIINYDRANSPSYWDKIWSNPGRRYERYSMQRAWWEIKNRKAKSVLDVGCGNGRLLFGVKHLDCFGVDISPVAIARMKKEFGVDGVAMSIYELEKVGRKFDFVVCNHTLEHLSKDRLALEKMKDCTNVGGTVFIAVPNNMSSPEETDEHCQMYDTNSLKKLMEEVFGNCETKIIGNHLIGVSTNI